MIIPNTNPALVVLSIWVNEDDDNDVRSCEMPIVGWHIDIGVFGDDEDVIKVERPVCVGVVDEDWIVLDKVTGKSWKPSGLG